MDADADPPKPAPRTMPEPREPREIREPREPRHAAPEPRPRPAPKPAPVAKEEEPDHSMPGSKTGSIQVTCRESSTVKISGIGSFEVTKRNFKLAPGAYQVMIKKADNTVSRVNVRVVAGLSVPVACD